MALTKIRQATTFFGTTLALTALAPAVAADPLSAEKFMKTHVGECISYKGETVGVQCFHEDVNGTYSDGAYTWTVN